MTLVRDTTYLFKNAFFDKLCESLMKPANEKMFFKHVQNFRNKNIDTLSSPYIENNIIFNSNGEDSKVVFRACGLEKEEVDKKLNEVLKAVKLDKTNQGKISAAGGNAANITSLRIVMLMMMAHYLDNPEKLRIVYLYYTYSFYFSVYTNFFQRKENINMECMKYTINNMTNKFDIKKAGSLEQVLDDTVATAINTYTDKLKRLSDIDMIEVINAIKTRVSHKMKSIRQEYQRNMDSGNRYFESIEKNDKGEFIIDKENSSVLVESLASEYTLTFFQSPIDLKIITLSAKLNSVSVNELRMAISLLHESVNQAELKEFYSCLFQLFFEAYPKAMKRDVNSNRFYVAADQIYKKGNSKDRNVIRTKELTHVWLQRGSNTYRSTTRPDTINDYRRAIYTYFVMVVSTKQ